MYEIIDILDNQNILNKVNKLKKEIALCCYRILNLGNAFETLLLNKLSINNNKYYDRDLVQEIERAPDIVHSLEIYLNSIKGLNTKYNLELYRNMNI